MKDSSRHIGQAAGMEVSIRFLDQGNIKNDDSITIENSCAIIFVDEVRGWRQNTFAGVEGEV